MNICMACGHPTVTGLLCVTCRSVTGPTVDYSSMVKTIVEARRLADAIVDAAIDWHKSDMDESMDAAQTLENAIEALLEFRRKTPIVKNR